MEDKNLAHMFLNRSRTHKKNPLILSYRKDHWNVISWRYSRRTVRKLALGLIAMGMNLGDRVTVVASNRAKWIFCDLAVLCAGGVVVPLQHDGTSDEVHRIVKESESRYLIVSDYNLLRKITSGSTRFPDVEKIIVLEMVTGIKEKDERITSYSEISRRGKGHERSHSFEERIEQITMDDPATIMFTTDAEGESKGVVLSHGNIHATIASLGGILATDQEDVFIHSLPLTYGPCRVFGYFLPIFAGGAMVISDSGEMEEKLFVNAHPTIALAVPRNLESIRKRILSKVDREKGAMGRKLFYWALDVGKRVLRASTEGKPVSFTLAMKYFFAQWFVFRKIKADFGGKLRMCICSGAPLVQELAEFFFTIGLPVFDAYGLTESTCVISMNSPENFKLGTVGKAIPGVEMRLSGDEEIQCRGANVMKGFYNDDEKRRQVMAGEWLITGDLGTIDEEGFLKITGRKKDVIITSAGENISPKSIENSLTISRYIKQANVVGNGRKYLTAIIVPDLNELREYAHSHELHFADMTDLLYSDEARKVLEEIVARVNEESGRQDRIRDFIIAESEFSVANNMLTSALKNNRRKIEEYYARQIERMYGS